MQTMLKNGFEALHFLERTMDGYKCCVFSNKEKTIRLILQKYLVKDVVGEIMNYMEEYTYPDLENPVEKVYGAACLESAISGFSIMVKSWDYDWSIPDPERGPSISRIADSILFGVYSKERPILKIHEPGKYGSEINLLETNIMDGDQRLWYLETPMFLAVLTYSVIHVCSKGVTKVLYGIKWGVEEGPQTAYTYKNLVKDSVCTSFKGSLYIGLTEMF